MRIALDLSSLLWTALGVGKDPEGYTVDHLGKDVHINTAKYAYETVINIIAAGMRDFSVTPTGLIIVEEGLNSKRRRMAISQTYKANRAEKHPDQYAEFQKLRDQIVTLLQGLGAIRCSQEGVEGDDVLGWLAQNTKSDLVVQTFDNDLMVLHGVNKHGAMVQVRVKGEQGVNKYGPFDHKLITTYKALVGDTSDNIKGCPGFGPAKFIDFVAKYGEDGLEELQELLEGGSLKPLNVLDSCKLVHMILTNEAAVIQSYRLAKIHAEWVDTVTAPLRWYGGMVKETCDDERLRRFRQQKRLVTTANAREAYAFLQQKAAETPWWSFDIETSATDESDDWMEAQGKADGVDVLGHRLTGFSITFGANHQYTYYVSVDHRDTANIDVEDARTIIEVATETGKPLVIQNTSFEGAVLATEEDNGKTWQEHWKNNGYEGFLPNWLDTVFEGSYVNENVPLGLKDRSKLYLGYEQQTFLETVCKTGPISELPPGGRVIKVLTWAEVEAEEGTKQIADLVTKQYKMKELTAEEVFSYGCDDTICTAGLHNLYMLIMELEGSWQTYLDVEIPASYQHVKNFLDGKSFSLETMKEQQKHDRGVYEGAWAAVRAYLVSKGWEGTQPPTYTQDITAKEIKQAYAIYQNLDDTEEDDEDASDEASDESTYHMEKPAEKAKDPVLSTRVRTPAKFPALLRAAGVDELFVQGLEACLKSAEGAAQFTGLVRNYFSGEPKFKISPKQMKHLLYEVMEMPIRVRNKPTPKMREKGIHEGQPMTNALAIKYALMECTEEQKLVLEGLQLMQMVKTREGLYYKTYPGFIHWKTGKIHSYHRQCATNTRRASSAQPNEQQMPKHPKIEGQASRFRECVVPHKKNAVVVSCDFVQQELVIISELSQDPGMLSCYVGDNKKDMHILTALSIINRKQPDKPWTYEHFKLALSDENHPDYKFAKKMRGIGKTCNFATEYGAMATKLSQTMMVTEEEAQTYIDAKEETFGQVAVWKQSVIDKAKETGKSFTMLGVPRHLAELLNSDDRFTASKAERQSVNFVVQSSSAEQTKLAEGRIWTRRLVYRYDAVVYGPIHDELVASVTLQDLPGFLREMHECMTENYAGMKLPNRSSISFGKTFGHQLEVGEDPCAPEVFAAIRQLTVEQ